MPMTGFSSRDDLGHRAVLGLLKVFIKQALKKHKVVAAEFSSPSRVQIVFCLAPSYLRACAMPERRSDQAIHSPRDVPKDTQNLSKK